MPSQPTLPVSLKLAVLLSFVGGFLDAYTYLDRGGVFAGAQTGNVVLMAVAAAQGEWNRAWHHLPPILAFGLGVFAADGLRRPAAAAILHRPALAAVTLEVVALITIGFIPSTVPDLFVTTVISFASALQLASFGTLSHWSYSSTMTTGNLRKMAQAAIRAGLDHDADARAEVVAFSAAIACFAIDAATGGVVALRLHDRAVWVPAGLLGLAAVMLIQEQRSGGEVGPDVYGTLFSPPQQRNDLAERRGTDTGGQVEHMAVAVERAQVEPDAQAIDLGTQ